MCRESEGLEERYTRGASAMRGNPRERLYGEKRAGDRLRETLPENGGRNTDGCAADSSLESDDIAFDRGEISDRDANVARQLSL